jgi:UDP-3-O-[3-hydroxymyristoyl] N-acetylglucosamine deacetylase / 3-hydroxyacyl-[acyl-carrier-protein] dehydratase
MSEPQQTLASSVSLEGVGVHSGAHARITLHGAAPDTGIRFRRTDLEHAPEVPADLDRVVDTDLGTSLGHGDVHILTVEHVLASLAACRIDNAVVELDGPEPPILDGGFREYMDAIDGAGTEKQEAQAKVFEVTQPVRVRLPGRSRYEAVPDAEFRVSATIDFEHPAIGIQRGHFRVEHGFLEEIAPARTFGFFRDAVALRSRGLARGASLRNTIVLDDDGVMNERLYFPDEFLRHKVGDLVGDLSLLGGRVKGLVVAERPSHRGNIALAKALRARANEKRVPAVDIEKLMEYLPHRYPMLLVDRIIDFESEKRIVGLKNVTVNEPFFQGHFPGHPIMPGVLLIEAMAQVGGLLLMESEEDPMSKVVYLVGIDKVKFRRPVTPGDQVVFELEMLSYKRRMCKMRGVGRVDGEVAVEGNLTATVVDR